MLIKYIFSFVCIYGILQELSNVRISDVATSRPEWVNNFAVTGDIKRLERK